MNGAFDELDQALDEEAWRRLVEDMPRIAAAVENAVKLGIAPDEVRRRVEMGIRDPDLAMACEMAARWLQRSK